MADGSPHADELEQAAAPPGQDPDPARTAVDDAEEREHELAVEAAERDGRLTAEQKAEAEDYFSISKRLDRAFDSALFVLEQALDGQRRRLESGDESAGYVGAVDREASAVRQIAQTVEALGLAEPPKPPIEVKGHDDAEVLSAVEEAGFTFDDGKKVLSRLAEREEERAMGAGS